MENYQTFNGFSSQSIDFLWGIGLNNCKQWVDEHRDEYRQYLLNPMKLLGKEIESYMNELNKDIQCISTVSRINRDVRFSKNKNPYKESIWFTLKPISEDWKDRPVYFFELKATQYIYGMGYYSAKPLTMSKFRKSVDENIDRFKEILKIFSKQNTFIVEGDRYKKKINAQYSEDIMNWYSRKNIDIMSYNDIDDLIFKFELVDKLKADFKSINEIYRYMWSIHKN